jgi:transcription initiation factor IIE alpha subunit
MTDDLFKSILSEYNQSIEDFGFTEVSEDVFEQEKATEVVNAILETEESTAKEYQNKLMELEKLILPFLIKLMNAKEVYIKWPHEVREPVIKAQIEKIVKLTRG